MTPFILPPYLQTEADESFRRWALSGESIHSPFIRTQAADLLNKAVGEEPGTQERFQYYISGGLAAIAALRKGGA